MHLTSDPLAMPTSAAEWHALTPDQMLALWNAWGDDMLVGISDSHLLNALPSDVLVWRIPDGQEDAVPFLEHHKIEFYYARLCCLSSEVIDVDLGMAIAPYVFDRVETHLISNSFDFSPTTVDIFAQHLESFTACGNVRIILSLDDFVELEPLGHLPVPAPPVAASKSHSRYEAYRSATSVREYLQLGGRRADLQYDLDHSYVAYTST